MADLGKNGINEIKGFSNPVPELDFCSHIKQKYHICKFDDVRRKITLVYSSYIGILKPKKKLQFSRSKQR